MLAVGAKGVISVVSNVVPSDVVAMINDFMSGHVRPAAKRHLRLFPLIKAMFIETNPTPVKAAMNLLGMSAGDPRLPLVPPTGASLKAIRRALTDYGLKPKRG
jgi:4-hydroxy-tetrahydrodipicolinate synthase